MATTIPTEHTFDLDYLVEVAGQWAMPTATERVYLRKFLPDWIDDEVTYQVCRLSDGKPIGRAEPTVEDALQDARYNLMRATYCNPPEFFHNRLK